MINLSILHPDGNWVKCGNCSSEFDLNKNNGCPLCGFGSNNKLIIKKNKNSLIKDNNVNYLDIPNDLKVISKKPIVNYQTKTVGSWGMFNSFFPGKAILRILANLLNENKSESMKLSDLIKTSSEVFNKRGFSKLRGFPNNPKKDNSIKRLVYHFIETFEEMSFFIVNSPEIKREKIWNEQWNNINITLSKEGLEFAKIRNIVLDNYEFVQVLTIEEKKWLLEYLKKIDSQGYKEYSMLKNVFEFIKQGHNGKDELWDWFRKNPAFVDYVKEWSRKANNPVAFNKQINNLSPTFAASKLALLRELNVIKNRRNDYTIISDL